MSIPQPQPIIITVNPSAGGRVRLSLACEVVETLPIDPMGLIGEWLGQVEAAGAGLLLAPVDELEALMDAAPMSIRPDADAADDSDQARYLFGYLRGLRNAVDDRETAASVAMFAGLCRPTTPTATPRCPCSHAGAAPQGTPEPVAAPHS